MKVQKGDCIGFAYISELERRKSGVEVMTFCSQFVLMLPEGPTVDNVGERWAISVRCVSSLVNPVSIWCGNFS